MSHNTANPPDKVLTDIADYAVNYKIKTAEAMESARLCMNDAIACALDALDYPDCTKLLGPVVSGTVVPNGSRIPGTAYELDPVTATFGFGSMIRWLDYNDTFTSAQGSHPSDNLAGILMLADHLSRRNTAVGRPGLAMRTVLEGLIKAYEIQGCLALENDFKTMGIDHNLLTRVAATAVLTRMLGGGRGEVVNAVSNAWMDATLTAFRHAPNTGWRKSWSTADASFQAMRLAMMAVKGEMGYPSVMTAKPYGFNAARNFGKPLKFQRPYGEYIISHSMFKFVTAGMHSQSAVECAFRLHPLVKDRIRDIKRVELRSQKALMGIMYKTGPLRNPADRDHCAQYVVAMGLIFGRLTARDFEDDVASDPRIDALREKTVVTEDKRYSRDFVDPKKRSSANALQVFFKDGTHTPKVEIEYPIGHSRRRSEVMPVLNAKLESALSRRFAPKRCERILAACNSPKLADMPAHEFVDLLVN